MSAASGAGGPARNEPCLKVKGLTKTFAGPPALASFGLEVAAGEVHALVGENGSGKSTFIKILSGYHRPDPGGEVSIAGRQLEFGSPASSCSLGCRFVHQELGLVDSASIADNLSLTTGFSCRLGTIRGREVRRQAREDLARVGLDLDPGLPVGELSPAMRAGVAAARALRLDPHHPARLLVLDEPTATLTDSEVRHLIGIVKAVAAAGVGVVYVTHRIDEVFEVADTLTVLRDGRRIDTLPVPGLTRQRLVALLVGQDPGTSPAAPAGARDPSPEAVLEVRCLAAGVLAGISFELAPGDVLGVTGITGSGREALLGTIFGATTRNPGSVRMHGQRLPPLRPDLAIAAGLAFLPAERGRDGGMMRLSARENLTIADLRPFWRRPLLSRRRETEECRRWFERLSVRPLGRFEEMLANFSGGNQQKILFAKWLRCRPAVLLLDEPTHGVDVGAQAELHRQLSAAAEQGSAVIFSSSDADELVAVAQQVLVLRHGRIVARLAGDQLSVANIQRVSLAPGDNDGLTSAGARDTVRTDEEGVPER